MDIRFCPIYSGSSGNSTYFGAGDVNLLVDAGLPGKHIVSGLQAVGVDPQALDGILVTHEHTDHVAGVGVLARRFSVPIYATTPTWAAMEKKIGAIPPKLIREITPDTDFYIGAVGITPVPIPHDAASPVGYHFSCHGHNAATFTDLGYIPTHVLDAASDCEVLLIESNHDVEMLRNGPYPYDLKQRILSRKGHLSNETCAQALVKLLERGVRNAYLGHLSADNNDPSLALQTVKSALMAAGAQEGRDFAVAMAKRSRPSAFYRST